MERKGDAGVEVKELERVESASEKDLELSRTTSVDSAHYDEALKILEDHIKNGGEESWTEQEEKRLRRKVDWRLIPVVCLSYGLQAYDKAMLSQAALFGLRDDLGLLEGNRYSFASSIFFIGYMLGTYPEMLLAQRFPAEKVMAVITVLWGLCLSLTTVCTNYQGLWTDRFFLGLLEAGSGPIFVMIVGSWYRKNEQAFRLGAFLSFAGFANMTAPLVNYAIGSIPGTSIATWKIMYLFAGILTMVWGLLLPIVLPADPIHCKMLKPRERYVAVARLRSNNAGVKNTHVKIAQILELVGDVKFWLCFGYAFFSLFSSAPLGTFIPIIINGFGFSALNSLLLTTPAGFYGGTMIVLASWVAYKKAGWRCYIVALLQMGTAISALLLWLLPLDNIGGLLFAAAILPNAVAGYAIMVGLQLANTAGYTKRAAASSGIFVGYCLGSFTAPFFFRDEDAPRYKPGFAVVVAGSVLGAMFMLIYRMICMFENRKRDKAGVAEGFDHAFEDDLTDQKNPQFRYVL